MMDNTASRAVPPPRRPWIMTQRWHHLLFAHWPCAPDALRPLLPRQVTLDTFAGEAWVGIVVFGLSGIRLRALSPIPLVARFLEINVRTYVTANNRPGVYFLSLDPNNPLAVAIARPWFRLAYQHARLDFQIAGDVVNFASTRLARGAPGAQFAVRYRPTSAVGWHRAGTVEHWLTERYCYYSTSRRGDTIWGAVHHEPWPLQAAEAWIGRNTMATAHGIEVRNTAPLLHYAHDMKARIWRPRRLTSQAAIMIPGIRIRT